MTTRYIFMACALSLFAPAAAIASEIDFSYNVQNLPSHGYGFGKAETYDVAIRIDEPSLTGTSITGISVEIPGGGLISGASGWLTNELTLRRDNGKYVNVPDIMSAEGVIADGFLNVTFDEPYTVAGPVYAGYTFTVDVADEATGEPVMIADGIDPCGLYVHSSRSRIKWNSISESAQGVSAMKVMVSGDFKDNSAAIGNPGELICSAEDTEVRFTLPVANHGLNPVEEITYSYTFAGETREGNATFPTPIPARWGISSDIEVTLPQPDFHGISDLSIDITSVNGAANNDFAPKTVIPVTVYPFIPVNRPIVEEYTGLWCGWCPKGYVALEYMHHLHPDQFIGIAYHSGDDMAANGCDWPNSPDGFPDGFINRTRANLSGVEEIWLRYATSTTPAEINVAIEWTDDTQTALKATSSTRFMDSHSKADFGVSYILVADGLSDPSWHQNNSYSGASAYDYPYMDNEWGEIFLKGGDTVEGLVFNDVALATKELNGFPGSIPSTINANEYISHSCVFNLDEIKPRKIIQDKDKLRVVAALIDRKSGKPVNCNTSLYPDGTNAVDSVAAEELPESTVWFNLQGVRIDSPAKGMGLLIRVDRFKDGTVNSTKQLF